MYTILWGSMWDARHGSFKEYRANVVCSDAFVFATYCRFLFR